MDGSTAACCGPATGAEGFRIISLFFATHQGFPDTLSGHHPMVRVVPMRENGGRGPLEGRIDMRWPDVHESFTTLVTPGMLAEAAADLDRARCRCTQAREILTGVRERLDLVLDDAFREGSFRPIEDLFREEEAALAQYEAAAARLAAARERWAGLRVALATERELIRQPGPGHRPH
jgi:hypothetical protein